MQVIVGGLCENGHMPEAKLDDLRFCVSCGEKLNMSPLALRIIEKTNMANRPGTCAKCAVDARKK